MKIYFVVMLTVLCYGLLTMDGFTQTGRDIKSGTGKQVTQKRECQAQKDLRNSLSILRNQLDLANKDLAKIKSEIEIAGIALQQMKTECPDQPTADHEKKLTDFKSRYEKIIKEQSGDKTGDTCITTSAKDEDYHQAEEEMLQAYYAAMKIHDIRSPNAFMFSDKQTVRTFYENAKAIDYANRKSKLDALIRKYPKSKEESYYSQFIAVHKKMNELTDQFLAAHVNALIEEAYKLKAGGKSKMNEAVEKIEIAVMILDAILLIDPIQPKAVELKKDAQSAYDAMRKELGAAVFTSAFHQKNAGKVVFSKLPVTIKSENASALSDKFKAGDYIYAMNYFKGTFTELTKTSNFGYTRMWINGVKVAELHFKLDSPQRDQSYLFTEIIPDPATAISRGATIYTKALSELSPRIHRIKVTTENEYGDILAEGEFELDATVGLDKIADIAKKLRDKELARVLMPAAKMKNAALESEMMNALTEWKEKPQRVVITQSDWEIHRHKITGAILYRTIGASVAFKTPEGDCKLFSLSFKQDYDGKTYGKTQHYGVGDSQIIPCENVNK